jgi:hypothetical protein
MATEAARLKCKTSYREEKEKPTGYSPAFSWKGLEAGAPRSKENVGLRVLIDAPGDASVFC